MQISGWFKDSHLSQKSSRSSQRKSHRSRFVTLNSGLNKNELLQLDPYIFYSNRHYLKEIEAKGNELKGRRYPLPNNYFYDFIKKYVEVYKQLSSSDIPIETRRENVKKIRDQISAIDKRYANNALLNERPILSVMLHGSFLDRELNWKDGSKSIAEPLKVDVIYISNPVLNNATYFMNSSEKKEYDTIILDLKYSSFLNKTLQQKQIDTVTQRLREFHTKIFEARIKSYDKQREEIKLEEEQIALFLRMKQKILSLGKTMPHDIEESNNKRQKELEFTKMHFEIHANLIKDFENAIHNKRNKFQVYYFKKGFKINKRLVKDNSPFPQGIFDVNNKNFFTDYVKKNEKSNDIIIQGDNIFISMDKFINYYYDQLDIKPQNIIIIDNSCSGFEKNGKPANKETSNKMRKIITNTQSRAKRSLNRSKMTLGKPYRSLSLNKPVKYIPLNRSKPLTNQEITNIQQSERQRQQKIMNEVEIQKELNKMVIRSPNRSHRSHSHRSHRSRNTHPHEDVYEQLQRSLGSKSRHDKNE